MMIFTGNANRPLAEAIARHLSLPVGRAVVGRFRDGEVLAQQRWLVDPGRPIPYTARRIHGIDDAMVRFEAYTRRIDDV